MDREESNEEPSVYIYNGVDRVQNDVTHVRVEGYVSIIPEGAFHDLQKLKVVELHEGLTVIGRSAFANCTQV